MRLRGNRRRAIVPIVAEVTMIGVTLIASLALGGFYFSLVGSGAHPAEVTVQATACTQVGTGETCSLSLANVGTSNTSTGSTCRLGDNAGTVTFGGTITAGGTLSGVKCTVTGFSVMSGSRIVGTIPLADGGAVYFVAVSS